MTREFEMIAKTFQGLEGVLAKELVALGAQDVTEIRRGVSFKGDKEMLYRANFFLRTALRVLVPIYKFEAESADEVYEIVKNFEWEKYIDDTKTFAIDATVFSDLFKHSQFLQYRVKDGIADHFMEKYGKRPSVRLTNPDLNINIHVADKTCTVSLDASGESLHKRGYREAQTEAPINEVLAAGMLLMAGWDGQKDFIDPMCGSGTFLCEAAMIALGIAPGLYRKSFAFQKWNDYDEELFSSIYDDDSKEREFEHKIYGSDILRKSIEISEANVKSAGVASCVVLSCCPFQDLKIPQSDAMIMFNPPYGARIGGDELPKLYEEIGVKLKQECQGKDVWIVTVPNEITSNIRLKPSFKLPLKNGDIDCELRRYELFSGRMLEHKLNHDVDSNVEYGERSSSESGESHRFKRDRDFREGGMANRQRPRREAGERGRYSRDEERPRRSFRSDDGDSERNIDSKYTRTDRRSSSRRESTDRDFRSDRRDDRRDRRDDFRGERRDRDYNRENREEKKEAYGTLGERPRFPRRYVTEDGTDLKEIDRYEYLKRRFTEKPVREPRERKPRRDHEERPLGERMRTRSHSKDDRFKGTKGNFRHGNHDFEDDGE